ncbi:MAG: hypothetical protein ACJ8AT_02935 [Hyalangium sp.]|uniref:hypothetical protein n=1 Tax=Hyalangium sp. TaxID=2028555 RepID=UPI003899CE5A
MAASDSAVTPYKDFCELQAELVYTVPTAGYYQVRIGCAANKACSGNLAVYVE